MIGIFCIFAFFANLLSKCSGPNQDRTESAEAGAYKACNAALMPELESSDSTERSVARAMFGSDHDSKAERQSSGTYAVRVSRAVNAGATSCPAEVVGACTVTGGRARVTEALHQEGYVPC
jgi:hypothetical protein